MKACWLLLGLALCAPGCVGGGTTTSGQTVPEPPKRDPRASVPADAVDYAAGPRLRGTVWDAEKERPLSGVVVTELSAADPSAPATGEDGVFTVELGDTANPALLVRKEGWLDTIQVCSAASRRYFEGEFQVELFQAEDERRAIAEETGRAYDPGLGLVVLAFQPSGAPAGVTARLEAPDAAHWISDSMDRATEGDRIPDLPGSGEILVTGVPPGSWPVDVESPAGLVCDGPDRVPVRADTATRAYFLCRSPDKQLADRQEEPSP